jgi:hypothetical protein
VRACEGATDSSAAVIAAGSAQRASFIYPPCLVDDRRECRLLVGCGTINIRLLIMNRPARIIAPIDVGRMILTFAAEDAVGPLTVRISLMPWENLRMAQPYTDDDDRRDAALSELEMLCTPDRVRKIDGERFVDVVSEDVEAIMARIERG